MSTPSPKPRQRFAMPDLADERASSVIDAFVTSPAQNRGRPDDAGAEAGEVNPLTTLATRIDWTEALRRESLRARRYRRPAAVVVVVAEPRTRHAADLDGWLPRVAGPIAHAIRRGGRETDLVTRAGEARFHVLLPETTERGATQFATRVVEDCEVWLRAMRAPVIVRAAAAAPAPGMTLEEALDRASGALGPID